MTEKQPASETSYKLISSHTMADDKRNVNIINGRLLQGLENLHLFL